MKDEKSKANPLTVERGLAERLGFDVERIRCGYYTDQYFNHTRRALETLAAEGYRFGGKSRAAHLGDLDLSTVRVGDIEADLQVFARRRPFSIAAGVESALAVVASCTGYFDEAGKFISTADRLEVRAVRDGARVEPWLPIMRIAGRYRDFAILETVVLGKIGGRWHDLAKEGRRALENPDLEPVSL